MKVESLHPGIAKERVQENTDFELLWAENLDESHPPTGQELEMLREEVDPLRYIIGT
jgi:glutaconate CoA-transferase subunit B